MNIGVLSDTHDNLPKIEKAVKFFNKRKAGFVIHAGDFVAPFAAEKLKALSCDFIGVFGNNDGEREGLSLVSQGKIQQGPLRITLAGRSILIVHDLNSINLREEDAQLVISGHSHKPDLQNEDSRLMVNPGECSGWLSRRPSVAIIDLDKLSPALFYL